MIYNLANINNFIYLFIYLFRHYKCIQNEYICNLISLYKMLQFTLHTTIFFFYSIYLDRTKTVKYYIKYYINHNLF
jgi:hypothetical protein